MLPLVREWTRIGRSLTADIRLDDPTVSRRHALVCRQEDRVRVLDDRSLNGICVNGERVEWDDLADGDELIIGRYRLYFLDTARVAATRLARPTRPEVGCGPCGTPRRVAERARPIGGRVSPLLLGRHRRVGLLALRAPTSGSGERASAAMPRMRRASSCWSERSSSCA